MTIRPVRRFMQTMAAASAAAIVAVPLAAQQLVYTGSLQVATGDYVFTSRTSNLYFASGLRLGLGRVGASVTVPVVVQSSGWVQYVGGGMLPSGGRHAGDGPDPHGMGSGMMSPASDAAGSVAGLGDPVGRLELDVLRDNGGASRARLTLAAKAPMASFERGLGTGAWDVGAGLSVTQPVDGVLLFGDVVYWSLGDVPDLNLKDVVSYSAGVGRPFPGGRVSLLASVLGTTSYVSGIAGPVQAGAGIGYHTASGRSVSLSLLGGLTRSAPDFAAAMSWQSPLSR